VALTVVVLGRVDAAHQRQLVHHRRGVRQELADSEEPSFV
jgi:hypothetical protein